MEGYDAGLNKNDVSNLLVMSGNDEKSNNNLTNSKNSNDISSVI